MPRIEHQTLIHVPREKVFRTLTTAEGWNAWFTDETSLVLKGKSGDIQLRWNGEGGTIEDGGAIVEVRENAYFAFEWSPGEGMTKVTFQLAEHDQGTIVTVKETGYSDSEKDIQACVGCAVGWGEALTLLKIYLEHGIVYKQDLIL
ncbi:SRPBCC family protein [Thalassobacillus hwangdonensis]|uniref:SRPBCC domain-containing protein n=1 Tax=Thalassobacillus hwangdonensis TaxID=546108 RepID=A0ABW3L506_9BACI